MARSIQVIYDSMVAEGIRLGEDAGRQDVVDMFSSTSRVAVWKIFFYAVAFCINVIEQLHDLFRREMDDKIDRLKPHSARWFAEKAKLFQYGYNLVAEADYYDNTGLTDDAIAASKIVSYAAVVEQERGVRIKVAKTAGDDLDALNISEVSAFSEYMARVKPAGIKVLITSSVADDLKASLRLFYNPLVLKSDGGRIDGTDGDPVQAALRTFLKNLPFNGLFVAQMAVDALQAVEGVVIVKDDVWQARYGILDYESVDYEYTPDAGYLRIAPENLEIEFIPHGSI